MAERGDISDEDQDIDIESDEEVGGTYVEGNQFLSEADKKAHHNALERKRRDHIKESFVGLRDTIPTLRHEKTSRAQILKHATEYIQFMNKKNSSIQKDIDSMKKQNQYLRQQAERVHGNVTPDLAEPRLVGPPPVANGDESSDGSEEPMTTRSKRRKRAPRVTR